MSATLDRLAAALADRYRLERELGAGRLLGRYGRYADAPEPVRR